MEWATILVFIVVRKMRFGQSHKMRLTPISTLNNIKNGVANKVKKKRYFYILGDGAIVPSL